MRRFLLLPTYLKTSQHLQRLAGFVRRMVCLWKEGSHRLGRQSDRRFPPASAAPRTPEYREPAAASGSSERVPTAPWSPVMRLGPVTTTREAFLANLGPEEDIVDPDIWRDISGEPNPDFPVSEVQDRGWRSGDTGWGASDRRRRRDRGWKQSSSSWYDRQG